MSICRYYCDYCDTYLTHDSVSISVLCILSIHSEITLEVALEYCLLKFPFVISI